MEKQVGRRSFGVSLKQAGQVSTAHIAIRSEIVDTLEGTEMTVEVGTTTFVSGIGLAHVFFRNIGKLLDPFYQELDQESAYSLGVVSSFLTAILQLSENIVNSPVFSDLVGFHGLQESIPKQIGYQRSLDIYKKLNQLLLANILNSMRRVRAIAKNRPWP